MTKLEQVFDEVKIVKLKFPDTIRKRFDMYIGSSNNPNQIVQELIDNGIDEILSDYATDLHIFTTDTYTIVADNGRGIPVYIDKEDPEFVITRALFSETHVGSKFDQNLKTDAAFTRGKNGVNIGALVQ